MSCPVGDVPRIHAWRSYGYRRHPAPVSGYYASRNVTVYVRKGEPMPEELAQ